MDTTSNPSLRYEGATRCGVYAAHETWRVDVPGLGARKPRRNSVSPCAGLYKRVRDVRRQRQRARYVSSGHDRLMTSLKRGVSVRDSRPSATKRAFGSKRTALRRRCAHSIEFPHVGLHRALSGSAGRCGPGRNRGVPSNGRTKCRGRSCAA